MLPYVHCGSHVFDHDFHFLHNPIVYGFAHLLYGVALSDSVVKSWFPSNRAQVLSKYGIYERLASVFTHVE